MQQFDWIFYFQREREEKRGCTIKGNAVQGNTEAMFYMLQVFWWFFFSILFYFFKRFVHKTAQKAHRLRLSSIL